MADDGVGGGLFGDDDDDIDAHAVSGQGYDNNYDDDALDDDDILGLDDVDEEDAAARIAADHEGSLLMRFCPHDSSMLYPKVSGINASFVCGVVYSLVKK